MIRGNWRAGVLGESFSEGKLGIPPPDFDSVYDLASLTKIIFTSSLIAEEWLNSGVSWQNFCAGAIRHQIPELSGTWLENVSLGELWEHRSGIMPHKPLFDPARRPPQKGERREQLWSQALPAILMEPPSGPRGQTIYSDLDFILLALYLERRHMKSLEDQWGEWKKMHGVAPDFLTFGVKPENDQRYAKTLPTEERHAKGEVNDDKSASFAGIATHSGLFGSCEEVWAWLEAIVRWESEDTRLKEWLTPPTEYFEGAPTGRFHGGWDRPTFFAESQGGYPSPPRALGHLGYTGTAFWWHPETRRAAVLLTNRVHPQHTEESQLEVKKLRQRFFSDFWQGKLSEGWHPPL